MKKLLIGYNNFEENCLAGDESLEIVNTFALEGRHLKHRVTYIAVER